MADVLVFGPRRFQSPHVLHLGMFVLVLIEDIVRIPPEEFNTEGEAIHHQVNQKFANKVRCARPHPSHPSFCPV